MSGTDIGASGTFCQTLGMGRPLRITTGGLVYQVLNRANARMGIFDKAEDYAASEGENGS